MSGSVDALDVALLDRFLRSVLYHGGHIVEHRFLSQAEDYAVVAVTLAEPQLEVVVKLAGPSAAMPCPFDRTAALVGLVRSRTAVLTFDVLAVDVSYEQWPWRYLVMTAVPGLPWFAARRHGSFARLHEINTSFGRAVGQLHAVRFVGCGEFDAAADIVGGTDYFTAFLTRARQRIANPAHASLFISLLSERAGLFDGIVGANICHEDLNPNNILVQESPERGLSTAIVDFDSAWAGCAESDLARLEFWRGMVGEGFWEAYRAEAPVAPGYSERRPLYQLLWCLEYARPTPTHNADTAALCASLDIAPIVFS